MTRARTLRLCAVGVLIGVLAAWSTATAASAHDSLEGADPAADSTVTMLTQVALTFSADPIGGDGADVIQVVGPDGRYYETGCPTLAGPVVTTPVAAGPAGQYRVEWRIVSSDGHPVSDSYSFTYEPDATAGEPATGSATPKCGSAAAETAAPAADTDGPVSGVWIGLGIGAVVAAALGVGVWLLIRRPRPHD